MSDAAVGFVGLGAMGGPMAANILARLGAVSVYDTVPAATQALADAGATVCASPAEVAKHASIVGVSLPTPDILHEVVTGKDGLVEGGFTTLIDFSTSGPHAALTLAHALDPRGIGYVDAPVSGGRPAAEAGTLSIMVSGAPEAITRATPVLEAVGNTIVPLGDKPGMAQTAKLLNNYLSAAAIIATGEALTLGARSGLDPAQLLKVINSGSGRNTATAEKYPKYVLPRTFDFGFRMDLMRKDLGLCVEWAEEQSVPMLMGGAVHQIWMLGAKTVGEQSDSTAIAKMFERWAGVELRGDD
jgi:3-hydroxyisobutyrate dehydrogenase-like beta-hydroxyacid dehydrogenase